MPKQSLGSAWTRSSFRGFQTANQNSEGSVWCFCLLHGVRGRGPALACLLAASPRVLELCSSLYSARASRAFSSKRLPSLLLGATVSRRKPMSGFTTPCVVISVVVPRGRFTSVCGCDVLWFMLREVHKVSQDTFRWLRSEVFDVMQWQEEVFQAGSTSKDL